MKNILYIIATIFLFSACNKSYEKGTFGYDLLFLNKHLQTVVLNNNKDKSQVIIVPEYQGRVMTSASNGLKGKSYGWINYDLISSGKFEEHVNIFGGEDRFWLGPEGGQYSIYFKQGANFTFDNWYTPKPIDTESFTLVEKTDTSAVFSKDMQLTNYHGYKFDIHVSRKVLLLDEETISKDLKIDLNSTVSFVGFQSENVIKNKGELTWAKETGLLSIWMLGMLIPSDNTTMIVPYKDSLMLNTSYFGEIGADRLNITPGAILFKADGKYRSKIGVPPQNALSVLGSYDSENNILTVIKYSIVDDTSYVNSLWKYQDDPYKGDAVNAYNDGPLENGEQLGPFYELESSSPAKELAPDASIKHIHRTYHFEGDYQSLNKIAKEVLKIDLDKLNFE